MPRAQKAFDPLPVRVPVEPARKGEQIGGEQKGRASDEAAVKAVEADMAGRYAQEFEPGLFGGNGDTRRRL
jgi:hypothetical protein